MNKVILMGRLTKDPEIRYTTGPEQMAVPRFTLAVDRRKRKDGGDPNTADFINCVAFDQSAKFAEKYYKQGTKIIIRGHIKTGSYTNREGQRVNTFDVEIEQSEFAESKRSETPQTYATAQTSGLGDDFLNIQPGDPGLPFN